MLLRVGVPAVMSTPSTEYPPAVQGLTPFNTFRSSVSALTGPTITPSLWASSFIFGGSCFQRQNPCVTYSLGRPFASAHSSSLSSHPRASSGDMRDISSASLASADGHIQHPTRSMSSS